MKPVIVPFFISHHGCPHLCVFCNQNKIAGIASTLPGADEIRAKTQQWRSNLPDGEPGPVEVAFFGGTFTCLSQQEQLQLLLPLQPLLDSGEVSSVRISTRPDAIDSDKCRFLIDHGVRLVELGVQSLDDRVLENAGRGHSVRDVEQAIACLAEAGMPVGFQLMPGLPGDSPETAIGSLRRLLGFRPSCLRFYPTLVIEGTRLADLYKEGRFSPLSIGEAVDLCKVMLLDAMRSGVPVIRIGLQPTVELESAGVVIAGPFHPAFRQLVESSLCYDLLRVLTAGVPSGSVVDVTCAPGKISDVAGQRRGNIHRIFSEQGIRVERVRENVDLPSWCIEVAVPGRISRGNLLSDLHY